MFREQVPHKSNRKEILEVLDENLSHCTGAVTPLSLSIQNTPVRGRKTFAGRDPGIVVAKLARAFAIGCPVYEACEYAGISRYAYYRFAAKYPELRNTLESLRMTKSMLARSAIADALYRGDWRAAFEYLKWKHPEEFANPESVYTTVSPVINYNGKV